MSNELDKANAGGNEDKTQSSLAADKEELC